uniref:PE family protein n=1 Tax=Mycobacterium sp. HUMS_1102779 TaxID=3383487 RepID=UPI00389AEE2D
MSYVIAAPEQVTAAAADLGYLGSSISSANAAAMGPASSVTPPGADEVSASIAALFGAHAQAYQLLSAQAAAFHDQFVQLMNGGAAQYALTEAANASPLQTAHQGMLSTAVNQSGQALSHAQPVMSAAAPAGSAAA